MVATPLASTTVAAMLCGGSKHAGAVHCTSLLFDELTGAPSTPSTVVQLKRSSVPSGSCALRLSAAVSPASTDSTLL